MDIQESKIRELMKLALQDRIDKNELTKTEIKNILYFANQDKNEALHDIHELMKANPETTFEYWINRYHPFMDAQKLIEWLDPFYNKELKEDDKIINMDKLPIDEYMAVLKKFMNHQTVTFNTDGTLKHIDEVDKYLSNLQAVTKSGLMLKSRQTREAIAIHKRTLVDPEFTNHFTESDVKHRHTLIAILELVSERINIRLEKYINLPEQPKEPTKSKPEPVTYQWTKEPKAQLPKLHSRLVDGGFIDPVTSLETFTVCFTGQPVQNIPSKIKWLKGGTSGTALLAYFLDSLVNKNKIPVDTMVWSIAEKCFDGYNRKALSQAKHQYLNNKKTNGKPSDHSLIDEVLFNL